MSEYMARNHVLQLGSHVTIKLNFQPFILRYTSLNETFEYSYPVILVFKGRAKESELLTVPYVSSNKGNWFPQSKGFKVTV